MNTLLNVIDRAERSGSQHGGEWHAPRCPWCGNGDDRLVIWPDHSHHETGMVWCRRCKESCDGIHFVREFRDMSWYEACEFFGLDPEATGDGAQEENAPFISISATPSDTSSFEGGGTTWKSYRPPGSRWRESARQFAEEARDRLWSDTKAAGSGRQYLYGRGLTDETIKRARLGLNPKDRYPRRTEWGLESREDRPDGGAVWLPRGIVIPWTDDAGVSGVNIRRSPKDVEPNSEDQWRRRKYQRASGPSAPLYGSRRVQDEKAVVIVEGEFDALAVRQEVGDLVVPVATGSTGGARRQEWLNILSQVPMVLVAFDPEEPGERASQAWLNALPNAFRWAPHASDTAEMLKQGKDLRMWVQCGLHAASVAR